MPANHTGIHGHGPKPKFLSVVAVVVVAASLIGVCRGQSEEQPATIESGATHCSKTGPGSIEGFWAAYPGGSPDLPAANAPPLAYLAIVEANRAVSVNGVLTNTPQESVNAAGYYDGCSLVANGRSCGKVAVYRAYFAQVTNGPPGGWYTLVVQGNITYSFIGRSASVQCPLDPAQATVIWVRQ